MNMKNIVYGYRLFTKSLLVVSIFVLGVCAAVPDPADAADSGFVTTWETTTPSESITIPTTGGGYLYNIDWGDGNTETGLTGNATHSYNDPGIYGVVITGDFPRIYFNNDGDKLKIKSVESWGSGAWTSFANAFEGAANLVVNTSGYPDLSGVTDLSYMFSRATSLDGDFQYWDVSTITNMRELFGSTSFNHDISGWNVSNVTNMGQMFAGTPFNQDISSWNVGNVTSMSQMFQGSDFNQNIGGWNVSQVTDMQEMFAYTPFNQDISAWNVSSAVTMNGMFSGSEFNQDISGWVFTGAPLAMANMFAGTPFNQDISAWNVSGVTSMAGMFSSSDFNQNIGGWNVGNVTSMSQMFQDTIFNQDISQWDTSSVTTMASMFRDNEDFDQKLEDWDVSHIVTSMGDHGMDDMFEGGRLSTAHYDAMLEAWSQQDIGSNINFDAGNSYYCTATAARQSLIDDHGWTITDLGNECPRTVTYVAGPGGTINPLVNPGDEVQTVDYGQKTNQVEAIPDSGNTFVNWSDGSTDNPRQEMSVTEDATFTANFATPPTAPTVTNGSATEITKTSARLSGNIVSTGGVNPQLRGVFYLRAADLIPSPHNVHQLSELGSFSAGEFSEVVSLDCGTDYAYLAFAKNSVDQSVGGGAPVQFSTKSCSGGGRGSPGYVCKDPKANNYEATGIEKNSLCTYDVNFSNSETVPGASAAVQNILGSGACPAHLIIHDFMKDGDTNGNHSAYNQKTVTEINILQAHINRILASQYKQAAGPVDGIFRKLTKQGVERLQVALNAVLKPVPVLKIDGIVGPFTRAAINNSCGGM